MNSLGQTKRGDAGDLRQSFGAFGCGVVAEPLRKRGDDRRTILAAHGENEGKAKARIVGCIQLLQPLQFLRCAGIESGAVLLVRRLCRQLGANRGAAGQLRVRANQRQLLHGRCRVHDCA